MSDDDYVSGGGAQNGVGGIPVSGGGTDLDFSVIFTALADDRRRLVLYYLKQHDPADLERVAEQVTAWEQEAPTSEIDSETREQVVLDLYHNHLPKLAETGIIEYDPRTGKLRYRKPPAFLDDLLDQTKGIELPDSDEP